MTGYLVGWSAACLLAAVLAAVERRRIVLFRREWLRFLGQPWKLASFLVAAGGLTLLAPYSGDPTWDYTDAAFMSVTTFVSAPWVAGVFYQIRRTPLSVVYVAVCVWLFSASWSYDLYIWSRHHIYPATWSSNLAASSVLYFAAGLLWSLEWRDGIRFSFQRADWPAPASGAQFRRIAWLALALMILVAIGFLPFFLPWLRAMHQP